MTTSSLIEIPLAIDLRFPNGPPYVRDLSQLPCQSLARDLVRALLERTNTSGSITSPATVKEFLTALRHLCRWMGDRGFEGAAGQLSEDLVFDYWRHSGARIEANTRKLLAQIEAKRPGTLRSDVASHLDGVRLHRVPSSTPHEPYSAGEAQRLLDVCKRLVTAAEARRAIADALVTGGTVHGDADSGDVAWLDEANLPGSSTPMVPTTPASWPTGSGTSCGGCSRWASAACIRSCFLASTRSSPSGSSSACRPGSAPRASTA